VCRFGTQQDELIKDRADIRIYVKISGFSTNRCTPVSREGSLWERKIKIGFYLDLDPF